ncbi:hypothetical protein [Streptomyces viridochromogenes]|nr:hypothetical protein [Streptomyces viridochromogenes]
MEQLTRDIRKTPLFRQLVPHEAAVGWPIPFRKPGKVYVTLAFFGMSAVPGQSGTQIFPPLSMVTVDWTTQRPVEYIDLRFRHPWPDDRVNGQVGVFPHQAVRHMSVDDYRRARADLMAMYDRLLASMIDGEQLPADWVEEFSQQLRILMEPGLEPYYRALSPSFFSRFLPDDRATDQGYRFGE